MQRFAVIGLGRFGEHLAKALTAAGAEVIAIDHDPGRVEQLRDEVALAVRLDSTDRAALESQGIDEVDAAVVGIGEDFESSVLTVATLREMGVPRIVARAMTVTQGQILLRVGAHSVVNAEDEAARRWAHRLVMPQLERYVELGEDHSLVYLRAPAAFHHKTPSQLGLRKRHGVNLIALRRTETTQTSDDEPPQQREVTTVPDPDMTILPNDILIFVGSNDSLRSLPTD